MKMSKMLNEVLGHMWLAVVGVLFAPLLFLFGCCYSLLTTLFFLLFSLAGNKKGAGEMLDEMQFIKELD